MSTFVDEGLVSCTAWPWGTVRGDLDWKNPLRLCCAFSVLVEEVSWILDFNLFVGRLDGLAGDRRFLSGLFTELELGAPGVGATDDRVVGNAS